MGHRQCESKHLQTIKQCRPSQPRINTKNPVNHLPGSPNRHDAGSMPVTKIKLQSRIPQPVFWQRAVSCSVSRETGQDIVWKFKLQQQIAGFGGNRRRGVVILGAQTSSAASSRRFPAHLWSIRELLIVCSVDQVAGRSPPSLSAMIVLECSSDACPFARF